MADNINIRENVAETILGAGIAIGEIKEKNELLYTVVPDGYRLETEDLQERNEALEERPRRITGEVSLANVESFCAFVEREFVENTTVCFAHLFHNAFTTIFNYDAPGGVPGWGDRKAILSLKKTSNWKRRTSNNRVKMTQLKFADFLEANMDDIVEPDAASIIEMVSALKVKKKAEFHSIVDQNTGFTSLQYTEDVKGEAIKGSVDFFGKFTIGLAPFYGSDPYKVKCNLRFSVDDQNRLEVFFQMINEESVTEDAFNVERSKIVERLTALGVPIFDQ